MLSFGLIRISVIISLCRQGLATGPVDDPLPVPKLTSASVSCTRVHWWQSGHRITSDGGIEDCESHIVPGDVQAAVGENGNSLPQPLHLAVRMAAFLLQSQMS